MPLILLVIKFQGRFWLNRADLESLALLGSNESSRGIAQMVLMCHPLPTGGGSVKTKHWLWRGYAWMRASPSSSSSSGRVYGEDGAEPLRALPSLKLKICIMPYTK